ncbi:MAG TPA: DUF4214 domain-containing protein, partial [Pirellulales bacterium]|nr:DUF4214 domain-containing protein [Pirellulales bacterium]
SVSAPVILPLSALGGFTIHATSGTAIVDAELATFSDPNGALGLSSYAAVIDWGDGTAAIAGELGVDSHGAMTVYGDYTYSQVGDFTITITITSARPGAPPGTSVQSSAFVAAPAVLALVARSGFLIHATGGVAFSNQQLAAFSDPNGTLPNSSYSSTINWGDGTATAAGVIGVDGLGGLAVFGAHTYSSAGQFTITVTISSARPGAPPGTSVESSASVAAPAVLPISASGGIVIHATRGTALINQELAVFSDPNGTLTTNLYSAAIDWGDGAATTAGVIAADSQGRLAVFGNHVYSRAGEYTITITISSARPAAPPGTIVQSSALIVQPPVGLRPAEYYVMAIYEALLGRTPSTSERQAAAQLLENGYPRMAYLNAVDHSPEYFHTLIAADYLKYLGRTVDMAGLAYWTSQMRAGLTDESLEALLVASAEYYVHSGGNNVDWVKRVYQDILGRLPDSSGVAYWTNYLAAGGSRKQVALGFATSVERESQHIERNYQQYLGRPADPAGLQYWLNAFLH